MTPFPPLSLIAVLLVVCGSVGYPGRVLQPRIPSSADLRGVLRGTGASAPAPSSAPMGLPAPAHRALAEDAALDIFVQSLAHDQALDVSEPASALAPASAVAAAAAPGAHRKLLSAKMPAAAAPAAAPARASSAKALVSAATALATAPSKVVSAKLLASAAKAPAAAPAKAGAAKAGAAKAAAAKPLASAIAPATAPYGKPAPAAQPTRRALSETSPRSPDVVADAPVKPVASALATAGQTAPAPPVLEE